MMLTLCPPKGLPLPVMPAVHAPQRVFALDLVHEHRHSIACRILHSARHRLLVCAGRTRISVIDLLRQLLLSRDCVHGAVHSGQPSSHFCKRCCQC